MYPVRKFLVLEPADREKRDDDVFTLCVNGRNFSSIPRTEETVCSYTWKDGTVLTELDFFTVMSEDKLLDADYFRKANIGVSITPVSDLDNDLTSKSIVDIPSTDIYAWCGPMRNIRDPIGTKLAIVSELVDATSGEFRSVFQPYTVVDGQVRMEEKIQYRNDTIEFATKASRLDTIRRACICVPENDATFCVSPLFKYDFFERNIVDVDVDDDIIEIRVRDVHSAINVVREIINKIDELDDHGVRFGPSDKATVLCLTLCPQQDNDVDVFSFFEYLKYLRFF